MTIALLHSLHLQQPSPAPDRGTGAHDGRPHVHGQDDPRNLRILHVDPERGWGGGEVQVLGLVRYLRAAGHQVAVAADPDGPLWNAMEGERVTRHALRIRHGFDLGAARILRRLAAGTDIVHFHTARAHALSLWLGRAGGVRIVTRRMDYLPRPRPYARVLYNKRVDWVVAISQPIRRVLIAAGVEADRISVIPSGVDVARFRAGGDTSARTRREVLGREAHGPLVLVVGALVRRKGHAVLLRAGQTLAARGLRPRYVFCGEGGERHDLGALARELGLADRVYFLGWRPEVAPLLGAADIVAVPSLQEGLGVAALEAMAAGRPVVASRIGGLGEVVVDGETGWLVPPGHPEALAGALEAAIRDPVEAKRRGAAAFARVTREFGMDRMGADNEALYRRLQRSHQAAGVAGT